MKDLNAVFQPEKICHAHGLQISYLHDEHIRNMFVYHENGQVRWSAIMLFHLCFSTNKCIGSIAAAYKTCCMDSHFLFDWRKTGRLTELLKCTFAFLHRVTYLTTQTVYLHGCRLCIPVLLSDSLQAIVTFFNAIRATRLAYLQKKHPTLHHDEARHAFKTFSSELKAWT